MITDSNAPTTRGNEFALAFTQDGITLHITTEQDVSNFTIVTKISGLPGFSETSPDSGLYSRTGTAQRGEFTVIQLQATFNGSSNLPVRSDGTDDESDRQKGLILTADNPTDELTVYALKIKISSGFLESTDVIMAINCVEFPMAKDYQYFIFTPFFFIILDQALITPCQDNTTISIRPSQPYTHASWVNSSVQHTPGSLSQEEAMYGRRFNRFDTLLLRNEGNLIGTIITSDKPLSVFSGGTGIQRYQVEQIPPHITYGDMFLLAPSDIQRSILSYRIGSVSDDAFLEVNCPCRPGSVTGNRVLLSGSGTSFTAVINRGQYVECETFNNSAFCSIQSTRPVTVMSYISMGIFAFFLFPELDLMVYIPPVDSYLTRYSQTSLSSPDSSVFLSYTLQEMYYEPNNPGLLVNQSVFTQPGGLNSIFCMNCVGSTPCGRGAIGSLGKGTFDINFFGNVPFGGYAYVYDSAAEEYVGYTLPFEMRPIGCKFYTQ